MKRLSYILLAAMLVAALAVSCTAEVIDDMGLVSVGFEGVRDNGSKGLTVAQAALDVYDSSLTWYYTAQKKAGDNTPATGATVKETKLEGGISTGKLTLSQGRWNFALYGYVGWISEEAKGTLVYKGSADQVEISGKSSKVQIAVSPQKSEEGKGSLVFKNGIVIVDGNKKSFAANYAEYKVLDTESLEPVELKLNEDTRIEGLKSATYEVTVYCKDKDFVYAQASAVVTIYDGLESVISGTLDENTAEAGFGVIKVDAAAGTTSQSQSITDSSEVEYKYGFSPASEGLSDTKTTTIKGSFAKTVEGEVSSLELKVYDRASSAQRFTLSDGEAVIAGFDFTLSNATVNGTVEVSAYIGEGYTMEKLAVVYNGSDAAQPTIVSYDSGVLTFTTTHFSEYYVTTSDACVLNENTMQKYLDLQDAIDNASEGDTIGLLGNVVLEKTVVVDKELVLDLNGKTISNTSDLWNESTGDWSLVSVRENGNLTITGNGALQAKEEDCFTVDVQDVNATVTIESGTLVGNVHAVYVFEGSAYINGGTYFVQQKYSDASKADEFVLNCYDTSRTNGTAKIVVTGGTFVDFNPANCQAEGAHTNFVDKGYGVDKNGNLYTVRLIKDSDVAMAEGVLYQSLDDAVEAVPANTPATIQILAGNVVFSGVSEKEVKFKGLGSNKTYLTLKTQQVGCDESIISFEDLTFQLKDKKTQYSGIPHAKALSFSNCIISGMGYYWGDSLKVGTGITVTFTNCIFADNDDYNMYLYSGNNFVFTNCKFYSSQGRFLKLYREMQNQVITVILKNCEFNGDSESKPALNIDPYLDPLCDISFEGTTTFEKVSSGLNDSKFFQIDRHGTGKVDSESITIVRKDGLGNVIETLYSYTTPSETV